MKIQEITDNYVNEKISHLALAVTKYAQIQKQATSQGPPSPLLFSVNPPPPSVKLTTGISRIVILVQDN
jgi:hypothetical protein